jgi:hypothetical protein
MITSDNRQEFSPTPIPGAMGRIQPVHGHVFPHSTAVGLKAPQLHDLPFPQCYPCAAVRSCHLSQLCAFQVLA